MLSISGELARRIIEEADARGWIPPSSTYPSY